MPEGRHRRPIAPPVIAADPERAARTEPPARVEPPQLPAVPDGHQVPDGNGGSADHRADVDHGAEVGHRAEDGLRAEVLPPARAGRRDAVALQEPASIDELVQSMKVLAARLVRNELALAKIGLRQRIKWLVAGVAMLGTSGLLAFFGLGCLIAAAVQGLNIVVQDWWACWIVAGGLMLISVLVVLPGWRGVQGRHPVRANTLASIKQDIATLRNALRR